VRLAAATLAGFALLVSISGSAQAAAVAIPLGTADSFVVLAGSGVTNTGPTTLNGDIGTLPTTSITGAASLTINGVNHAGDGVTATAKSDLSTAYDNASGQGPVDETISANLGGRVLLPGVYFQAGTMNLTGALTLDAGGNPDAVWVFRTNSDLIVAGSASVVLTNGAQACNVFWRVGSSATIGTSATFRETILALTSITVATNATIYGRALAQTGTVTLDSNTITRIPCSAAVPGGVGTGDGSTSQAVGNVGTYILAAAVLAVGIGATAVLVTRRRREGDF
jgi:hypothetical protein